MSETASDRMTTLPKWAKQEIDLLRMRLNEANARLAELAGEPTSEPGTLHYSDYNHDYAIPARDHVVFHTSTGEVQAKLVRRDGRVVLEMATSALHLVLRPVASNLIRVEADPR